MSAQHRYFAILVVGPVAYLATWLILLPVVAQVSVPTAVLSLTFLTSLYCFLMEREKKRNETLWSILGLLAGFVELGLVPILVISALSSKHQTRISTK